MVEHEALLSLVESGHVVVAAGGGGIPVVERDGRLSGVSAVIDKDRTAAVLAGIVGADLLVVLTDVDQVQLGFGTDQQRAVDRLAVADARRLLAEGVFGEGTMAPKVEACAAFVEHGGRAAIGSLEQIAEVIAGTAGTVFVRESRDE